MLGRRFALDFVQANEALQTHTSRGTNAEEYFCYGHAICAAADGTVVAVEDRVAKRSSAGVSVTSRPAAASAITCLSSMPRESLGCTRISSVAASPLRLATVSTAAKSSATAVTPATCRRDPHELRRRLIGTAVTAYSDKRRGWLT